MQTALFQSTLPTRGSDIPRRKTARWCSLHFNPRSPRGGATRGACSVKKERPNFNPRSPRGGATSRYRHFVRRLKFQSTLPTRGSDAHAVLSIPIHRRISIHAPHEGERPQPSWRGACAIYFNPRSPRGGATLLIAPWDNPKRISIHAPHEGERQDGIELIISHNHFNPRSPRGGATGADVYWYKDRTISIHAPHEGERQAIRPLFAGERRFQSTLPTRGSDRSGSRNAITHTDFNPRSPRGGATPP